MAKVSFVYTTWPTRESAEKAAREIVQEKLAACANVLASGTSFYIWKKKLETATETIVIFKTATPLEKRLEEKIKTIHPSTLPCILSLDVNGGHAPYLDWVHSQVN